MHIENNIESELYDYCVKGRIPVSNAEHAPKLIVSIPYMYIFACRIKTFCQERGNKRDTVNNIGK